MPIDEIKFGELIGTVGSLVTAVADMKAAILPALREQRLEMSKYREDCRDAMDIHKKDDLDKHDMLENLCKPLADLQDEIYGDGSRGGEPGLRARVNDLVIDKIKIKAWAAGVAAVISLIGIGIGWAVEAHYR